MAKYDDIISEYSLTGTKLAQLLFDLSVMTWQRKPNS